MDYKEIETLLEKYFEGHSTSAEEDQLRAFFESDRDLPPELQSASAMFRHFKAESTEKMDQPVMRVVHNTKRRKSWQWMGVAASVACVLSAALWFNPNENTTYAFINGQPINEQEVALEEMKKALSIMTSHLNQGTEGLSQLSKFDQIKKSISK